MAIKNMDPHYQEARQRMSRALRSLLANQRFFANLALHMPFIEDNSRKTIAADGQNIRYNTEWVRQASSDDIKLAICRVVFACALKHHTRRHDRDYRKWQLASQMVTLPIIRDAGLTRMSGGMEMSIENAFLSLPDEPPDDSQDPNDDSSSDPNGQGEVMDSPKGQGKGEGEGDGEGGGEGDGESDKDQKSDGDQQGDGQGNDGEGDGQSSPKPQSKSTDLQDEERRWDMMMHQAQQMGKAAGDLPGKIAELLESAHHSQADWRTLLRRYVGSFSKKDYSWVVPNLRHIDSGLYLPSLYLPAVHRIVFAIDTSGSLSRDALSDIWGEIRSICEELEPDQVTVMQCDSRISDVENYPGADLPMELVVRGRGGTAFRPVFEYIEDEGNWPQFMIYLTDLECKDFGPEPGYPVFWAFANDSGYQQRHDPPFGMVVDLARDKVRV